MLYIIGLGLSDGDISERGLEALEKVEEAYAELYTNSIDHDLEALEDRTGTGIEVLERSAVEEEDRLVEEAGESDVAFLVSGDPLAATTHQDILFRARKRGIGTEVVHAPSVFTAAAETGMSLYKFGRTTTLTVQNSGNSENSLDRANSSSSSSGEVPGSVFEAVELNRENGLHTLVLVDPEAEWEEMAGAFQDLEGELLVCSSLGRPDAEVSRVDPGEMEEAEVKEPVSLVVPGELSDNERERLESINLEGREDGN